MSLAESEHFELYFHLYIVTSAGISRHWRFLPLKIFCLAFSRNILPHFLAAELFIQLPKQKNKTGAIQAPRSSAETKRTPGTYSVVPENLLKKSNSARGR